jgi:hypothetical protein
MKKSRKLNGVWLDVIWPCPLTPLPCRQEGVEVVSTKKQLMTRRALRKKPEVVEATRIFWECFGNLRVSGQYMPHDVYITFHTKDPHSTRHHG